MSRLIDADLLMKTVFNDVVLVDGEVKGVGLILAETVDKAPAVDAVEVVRCRECKHCDQENHHCDHHMGTAAPLRRKPDDFCSYGERKSNEYAEG